MKYFLRLFLAALTVAGGALFFTPAAQAAKDNNDPAASTTWSVTPADKHGPDGRAWVSLELEPGQEHTDYLAVKNLGSQSATFSVQSADGYFTDTGRFNMLPAGEESSGAGTWLVTEPKVTLAPGETKVLPFTVRVPENAAPGDHAAGLAAVLSAVGHGAEGTVGVDSRVGFRVMIQVAGEPAPALNIASVHTSFEPAWNPFAPGTLTASLEVENRGNLVLSPELSMHTWQGSVDHAEELTLLPGEQRTYTLRSETMWPTLLLPTEVRAEARPAFQGTTLLAQADQKSLTWAWPVSQLLVLVGAALIVSGVRTRRRRNQQQLAALIAAAKAEGRAEARTHERTREREPVR